MREPRFQCGDEEILALGWSRRVCKYILSAFGLLLGLGTAVIGILFGVGHLDHPMCALEYPSLISDSPCRNNTNVFSGKSLWSDCFVEQKLTLTANDCVSNLKGPLIVEFDLGQAVSREGFSTTQLLKHKSPGSSDCLNAKEAWDDPAKTLYPCGLYSMALFNDTLTIGSVEIHDNYYADHTTALMLRNPPVSKKTHFWVPEALFPGRMENFRVRMWFSKRYRTNQFLYGFIWDDVHLPVEVTIQDRWPSTGTKVLRLSGYDWVTDDGRMVCVAFLCCGLCLIIGTVSTVAFTIVVSHKRTRYIEERLKKQE